MRTVARRLGIGFAVLLTFVAMALVAMFFVGRSKFDRNYEVSVTALNITGDEEALARGEHLVRTVSDCIGCHGENLEGALFSDDPALGILYAPNLTSGEGGVGATYTDTGWIKALRHGVGGDGRALLLMPSQFYTEYSNEDLSAVIAYLKSLPPIDNVTPDRNGTILLNILLGIGAFPTAYELIDQDRVWEDKLTIQDGEAAGKYLVDISACRECHGQNLSGRITENGPPPGPNLTPGGELQSWNSADFAHAIQEGITPSGQQLSDEMPWRAYSGMSEEELQSIWLYLQSLPPLETASQ